jgi:hypothetical protein
MNESSNKKQELWEKEQELHQRELKIRLSELETEINRAEPPLHPTIKHHNDEKLARSFKKDFITLVKLSGFFFGGLVVIYVSQWLAWISAFAIVIGAGFLWFKLRQPK